MDLTLKVLSKRKHSTYFGGSMSEKPSTYEINGVTFASWSKSTLTTGGEQAPYSTINKPKESVKLEARTDDDGVFRMVNGRLRVEANGKSRKLTQRDREIIRQSAHDAPMTQDAWRFIKKANLARKRLKSE